ncbi:acyl-CoA dehydrogenase family protein [Myxococcaceae bacterium GXIMD 01537]
MTEHPLLAAARELAPRLAARSEEIEAARRLPADLARELAKAGLFRLALPEIYGGPELHPVHIIEVVELLAREDASVGWCVMIAGCTAQSAAWLAEPTARAIFSSPEVIVGGVAAPLGRAERVDGGYRLTGRWPWASGAQNADWLVGGAVVMEGGQPRWLREGIPETRLFYVPASEVTLHDTWHAAGLCGTGSVDMEVRDVFVPAERGFSLTLEKAKLARPLYAFPPGLLALGIPAVALGIARRAIDELKALSQKKVLLPSRRPLATRPAVQEAIAEAEATWRSARAFLIEAAQAIYDEATRGEPTLTRRAELRLAMTHATRSAARVVDRMYEAAGGTAVYDVSPLQRCFRDVHVATQHAMVAAPTLETIGCVMLGVETDTSRL